jgi:hypothetical protein
MKIAVMAATLVLVAGACASSGTAATDQTATATRTSARSNVITQQEINESKAVSLADLVRQLRPSWPTNAAIYVNNDHFGGYEQLRSLPLRSTKEVRYLSRSEAQMRIPSAGRAGAGTLEVIQIITK